jgi:octanoyl-[GcvH]:protein N-octanoyltransferase
MELLLPDRFERAATAYGYQRVIFEQVAAGVRPPTVSITPSTRHVGVARRDTFRPGFTDAVRASCEEGYPVLVRSSGGGATAAHHGTFGFSMIRPATVSRVAAHRPRPLRRSRSFCGVGRPHPRLA